MTRLGLIRLATGLWCLLVALFLLTPISPESEDYLPRWIAWIVFPGSDKLVHGFLFFVLAYLATVAVRPLRARRLTAFVASSAYGGLTELIQHATATRSAELGDWLADVAGALLGVLVVTVLARAVAARSTEPA